VFVDGVFVVGDGVVGKVEVVVLVVVDDVFELVVVEVV